MHSRAFQPSLRDYSSLTAQPRTPSFGLRPGLSSGRPFPGFPVELGGFDKLHAPFLTERRTRGLVQRCVAGNPGSPDFLWNLVALANFMRLSLLKVARAASSSAAWQDNPGSPD